MEFTELTQQRRSVRAYAAGAQVSRETIEDILRTAQLAPSWKNSQTGRYHVCMGAEKIAEVSGACLPTFNQKSSQHACALLICSYVHGVAGFNGAEPANELGDQWGAYDLGLQNAYLILRARELGYDTLIMGIRDAEKIREILSIPSDETIVGVIALGKRSEEPVCKPRKDLSEIVRFYA